MSKKKFHNIVVFTGGEFPPIHTLFKIIPRSKIDFVIAADSGLSIALKAGLVPNVILGDFDSIIDRSLLTHFPNSSIFRYPHDKDFTDTQLALRRAHKVCAKDGRVFLFGGAGGRVDHFFSNYNTFCRHYHAAVWFTTEQVIYFIKKGDNLILKDTTSSAIGVLRLSNRYTGGKIETNGLQWEGHDFFKKGIPTSCNRIADDNKSRCATIRVIQGKFLLCVGYSATVKNLLDH